MLSCWHDVLLYRPSLATGLSLTAEAFTVYWVVSVKQKSWRIRLLFWSNCFQSRTNPFPKIKRFPGYWFSFIFIRQSTSDAPNKLLYMLFLPETGGVNKNACTWHKWMECFKIGPSVGTFCFNSLGDSGACGSPIVQVALDQPVENIKSSSFFVVNICENGWCYGMNPNEFNSHIGLWVNSFHSFLTN